MSKRQKKEKEVMIRRNDDDDKRVVECGEDWEVERGGERQFQQFGVE